MFRIITLTILSMCLLFSACGEGERYETSSVFVTINDFTHKFPPNSTHTVPVIITTRGKKGWEGELRVMVKKGEEILHQNQMEVEVEKESEKEVSLDIQLPEAEDTYEIVAEITGHHGNPVKNRRLIEVDKPLM